MQRITFLALGLASLSLIVGCTEEGPDTHPVTGKVTIGGQAPQGVSITFQPLGSQQPASGQLDAGGNYTLYTGAQGKVGAEPGEYKVVLTQISGGSAEMYKPSATGGTSSAAPVIKASFPEDWAKADSSPKKVEVKAEDNVIDIEVPAP